MGTTRFVLRTDTPFKDGSSPIQLVYQISGQRKYYKTGKKLHAANWNPDQQQAIFIDKKKAKELFPETSFDLLLTHRQIMDVNERLISIKKEVAAIEAKFESQGIIYSTGDVIIHLKNKRSPITKIDTPSNEIFDFIDKYIEDHKTTREPGSLSIYKSVKNHLQRFQIDKKRKVTFENIDYSFFQDYQNYLITSRDLNNTTVAKQLSTIKTFLNYAQLRGFVVNNQYKDFKIKKENLEVIALTNEEFELLYNFDLSENNKLDQVRDVFCFACATGLRFSDIQQLRSEHIKRDEIRLIVKKTKELLSIPLTSYSAKILSKYKDRQRPLPVISNQKTNTYLHELCKKAGINEPVEIVRFRGAKRETNVYPKYELISFHTGRKTFCTLSLEKGLSAEEVMQISGHKDYKSFKRYVRITEKRTKLVMGNAWGKPLSKLKAV